MNEPMTRRRPWALPVAGVVAVALLAAGLGAYFGIRAAVGGPAGSTGPGPAPRSGAAMAFDPATGTVLLFGGSGAGGALGDTWTWDGSVWTERHPASSPPASAVATAAYDPASHAVVLVTQVGPGGGGSGQTWLWDGASWHRAAAAPQGGSLRLATDRVSGHAVLVSLGAAAEPLLGRPCQVVPPVAQPNDIVCPAPRPVPPAAWEWTGSAWSRQAAGPPEALTSAAGSPFLVTDPASGRPELVVIFPGITVCPATGSPAPTGGSQPGQRPLLTPPPDVTPASAPPTPGGAVPLPCVEGGLGVQAVLTPSLAASEWSGSAWTAPRQLAISHSRGGGAFSAVADPAGRAVLLLDAAQRQAWAYDGAVHQLSGSLPSGLPAAGSSAAYDAAGGRVVVFGGVLAGPGAGASELSGRTWTWDGSQWTLAGGTVAPLPAPTANSGSAIPG